MTFLSILGVIVLLLLILLCLPVGVDAAFREGQIIARVRYSFFTYPLYPAKPKKRKTEQKPKKQKEKQPEATERKKKKGVGQTAREILELLKASRGGIRILRRHLVFSHMHIVMRVSSEDAYQTAMLYAHMNNITELSLSVIEELFVLKQPQIDIQPDFLASSMQYDIALRISIRPIWIIAASVSILAAYLRIQKKRKLIRQPSA